MTQGRITAGQAGGKTLLQVNNYAIHGLVHPEFKYVKLNTESKGNLVENFGAYTEQHKDRLNAYVVDLSGSTNGIKLKYTDEICISNYDLSPLCIASRLCFSFEEHWSVL